MMRAMPSFSASRLACSGAAPPNATSVRSAIATPRSTACTRAALAMFSSTISATATAACSAAMPASFAPTPDASAALGLGHIDRDLAAGEARRVDLADHQVRIRHGRLGAAAAVAGRPRLGAGAVGPDQDALQGIDAGNRAAAGADLHHLDDGDAHGRAAALLEARLRGPPRTRAPSAARRRRSGRSWRWCRPCRTTGCGARRARARCAPPGWRRRPARTPPGARESAPPSRGSPGCRPKSSGGWARGSPARIISRASRRR